jgi:hypothetical protein
MLSSGDESEVGRFAVVEAHALWHRDAKAIEERGLSGIRLGDAAQADIAVRCGRQHDVVRLDGREFFEDGSGELPRPERCCHISRHFHITKARKHTRM